MVSANQTATIVTITSPGPQGPQGPTGPPGGATTGSNTFTGDQTITGSILISGSIIPAVGAGQTTSSFDLGSETAAWRDIYVSEGSIKFIKSGSAEIVLSAKDGGISIDGGSTISADGVSGQFITSKSLGDNVTVKDSNNSLLMGPIEVETDKEIIGIYNKFLFRKDKISTFEIENIRQNGIIKRVLDNGRLLIELEELGVRNFGAKEIKLLY